MSAIWKSTNLQQLKIIMFVFHDADSITFTQHVGLSILLFILPDLNMKESTGSRCNNLESEDWWSKDGGDDNHQFSLASLEGNALICEGPSMKPSVTHATFMSHRRITCLSQSSEFIAWYLLWLPPTASIVRPEFWWNITNQDTRFKLWVPAVIYLPEVVITSCWNPDCDEIAPGLGIRYLKQKLDHD